MSPKQFKENLLDKIHGGEIKMKSKSYFALRSVAYVIGLILTFGLVFYLTSFTHFVLQSKGLLMLPEFGFRGLGLMFISLPWLLVILIVTLVVLIEILSKHFKFIYRKPLVYSTVLVMVVVLLGSMVLARTHLHYSLANIALDRDLPIAGPLYKHYNKMYFKHAHLGTVLETADDQLIIELPDTSQIIVLITAATRLPRKDKITTGDLVMVGGSKDNGTIEAFGIRKVSADQTWLFSNSQGLRVPKELK